DVAESSTDQKKEENSEDHKENERSPDQKKEENSEDHKENERSTDQKKKENSEDHKENKSSTYQKKAENKNAASLYKKPEHVFRFCCFNYFLYVSSSLFVKHLREITRDHYWSL
ncbi:unnamed protein product, partial [Candidula unifasciata]